MGCNQNLKFFYLCYQHTLLAITFGLIVFHISWSISHLPLVLVEKKAKDSRMIGVIETHTLLLRNHFDNLEKSKSV